MLFVTIIDLLVSTFLWKITRHCAIYKFDLTYAFLIPTFVVELSKIGVIEADDGIADEVGRALALTVRVPAVDGHKRHLKQNDI